MNRIIVFLCFILPFSFLKGQGDESSLELLTREKAEIQIQMDVIDMRIEEVKLKNIITDLEKVGLPSENYIKHSAMILEYSEEHEQAKWVAHIITPDVLHGSISRTNDFRIDPMVKTGTAIKEDYFLEIFELDSSIVYDGYGYDRGHLAPSADFRWSKKALSESYFYSNMSPQLPEFNREIWGDLESHIRGYFYSHTGSDLYVVTLPILEDDLPVIERGLNKVSIPRRYVKVVMDLKEQKGVAFVMENRQTDIPLNEFAVSIDEVEKLTGYDFFNKLDESIQAKIEFTYDEKYWFSDFAIGNVKPLYQPNMPKGHFNTTNAKLYIKKKDKIKVCGTVVSSRYSKKQNAMLQLDQKYPNEIFTVFIKKENLINFSFDPVKTLEGKCFCFKGTVDNFFGHPSMTIEKESFLEEYLLNP